MTHPASRKSAGWYGGSFAGWSSWQKVVCCRGDVLEPVSSLSWTTLLAKREPPMVDVDAGSA